jgi:hypothetical protein
MQAVHCRSIERMDLAPGICMVQNQMPTLHTPSADVLFNLRSDWRLSRGTLFVIRRVKEYYLGSHRIWIGFASLLVLTRIYPKETYSSGPAFRYCLTIDDVSQSWQARSSPTGVLYTLDPIYISILRFRQIPAGLLNTLKIARWVLERKK